MTDKAILLATGLVASVSFADYSRTNPKYPNELDFTVSCVEQIECKDLTPLNDHTSKGIGWNHWPKTFICSLESSADLEFVEVELPRGSRSTLVREVSVAVDDGSGDFGPSKSVVTYGAYDHYPKAGEPKVNEDCTNHWYRIDVPGRASRVKVRIGGIAWHACGEIRICGKPVSERSPSPGFEKGRPIVLRNGHWDVAVDPLGARIVKLAAKKTGLDFAFGEGLFTEDCWNVPQSAWYFLNKPFACETTADDTSLKATAKALGSGISFFEVNKAYSFEGETLKLDYLIRNQQAAMSDQSFSPRIRLRLKASEGVTTYVFPTARGLKDVSDANPPVDFLVDDAVRGWFAVKGEDGRGIIFRFDESETAALKAIFPEGGGARIDWSIVPMFIPCGETHPLTITMTPFESLEAILTAEDRLTTPGKTRRGAPETDFDYNVYTNFQKHAGTSWARPAAQGPVKALILTTFMDGIEIGRLAERFDVDFKTTVFAYNGQTLSNGDPKWWIGDYFNVSKSSDFVNSLRKNIESDWDVLVLGGVPFGAIPEELRKIALEKIEKGKGLVTVGQNREDASIGVTGKGQGRVLGVAKRVTDDFASVPFSLLSEVFTDRWSPVGTIHATIAGQPFMGESKLGAGTHVRLYYSAIYGSNAGHSPRGSITPPLKGFYADRIPPTEEYYLLVYKAMLRAIGRENPFNLAAVELSGSEANFTISLPAAGETKWEWSVKNQFGDILQKDSFRKTLQKGVNEIALDDFAPPKYGDKLCLRLAVRTDRGLVLDLGEWAFENRPSAEIVKFVAEKRYYDEGETVKFSGEIKGAADGAKLQITLIDHFGRHVASRELACAANFAAEVKIENALVSKAYELRAALVENGREISRRRAELIVRPDPQKDVWDDFEPGGWFPDNVREHLWPEFAELCREEMRYKIVLANHAPMQDEFSTRFGFSSCCHSEAGLWRSSPEPKAYAQTGDKMKLVRTPCLSTPERAAKTVTNLTYAAGKSHRAGARFVWLGDELSLTGYDGEAIDYCFGEHCLKAFRLWLKSRYGTLDQLNAAWETAFATWEDVLPFTRQEVWATKELKHVAGWADHLEFMDGRYTNQQQIAKTTLLALDPEATIATSGTQRSSAYGALDWWKQTRVLDGLLSYANGGQLEIHRSFLTGPKQFLLPWQWGYSRRGADAIHSIWEVAFLGGKGVMGFESSSQISPDWTLSKGARDTRAAIHRLTNGTGKHLINNLYPAYDVAVLYSQASIRAAYIEKRVDEYSDNRIKWAALMRNLGCNWRFFSYDELMAGDLLKQGFKALVLQDAVALSDREIAAISEFRAKGGVVLAEGVPGRREWNCRVRAEEPLKDLKHLKRVADNAYLKALDNVRGAEAAAEIVRAQKAVAAALSEAKAVFMGVRIFDAETGQAVRNAYIYPRTDAAGNHFYGVLSKEAVPRRVRFVFPKKAHVYDLVDGRYHGCADEVELPLGKAIGHAFQLMPEKVTAGSKVDTVLRRTVYRPDGSEALACRANVLVKGGAFDRAIPFVASDPAGTWKVVYENVLGGEKNEMTLKR